MFGWVLLSFIPQFNVYYYVQNNVKNIFILNEDKYVLYKNIGAVINSIYNVSQRK